MLIKQLEWTENRGDFEAFGFFGCFQVVEIDGRWEGALNDANEYDSFEPHDFETADEAKAYCQSLLEKQIQGAFRFVDWSGKKSLKEVANFLGASIKREKGYGWVVCLDASVENGMLEEAHEISQLPSSINIDFDYYFGGNGLTLPDNWEGVK